jgi:hypothetical protein
MLRSEKAGEKICKKGLDNSGNIEGFLRQSRNCWLVSEIEGRLHS